MSPIFAKLSDDPTFASVEFYKVDVDEQEQISQEVGVRAVRHISCYFFLIPSP
jgi:thioredoxin 1